MKAILDLGTNTFQLLIGEVQNNRLFALVNEEIPVKLGQGGIHKGTLQPEAMERGLHTLVEFRRIIDDKGITDVVAIGTSALRSAANAGDFIARVRAETGIEIRVIDGAEEARLIFEAVRHSFPLPPEPFMLLDIGGGSVEIVIGSRAGILWKQSFEAGTARLLHTLALHDPPRVNEVKDAETFFRSTFIQVAEEALRHRVGILAGSAGFFDTLTSVMHQGAGYAGTALEPAARQFEISQVREFFSLMKRCGHDERSRLPGMTDFRVDTIGVASLLTEFICDSCRIGLLVASRYSLKEGVLFTGAE
jgi:exopolyphosphatase/guanosine-5'-triphosphate,3'-diphosphate pyrophosphatase